MHWRSALENRRFRGVLLGVAGIPVAVLYVWRTVLLPLVIGEVPPDFGDNYMRAAVKIAMGRDPYDLCLIQGCPGQPFRPIPVAGIQYVTPPPVAWMLQPLVGAGSHAQLAVVLVVLQFSLILFVVTTLRALDVRGWQMRALLAIVALGFEPVIGNIDEGQINLVLLGLSGVWLLGWIKGDRWWGGAALGLGVAMKLLQAPLGLLLLWGRRWRMLAAATIAGLGLLLLAVPQYLPEYVFKVLPVISSGTGLFENHSPGGTVARLFDPSSFLGLSLEPPVTARVITVLIGLGALVITFSILGRPRRHRNGRALEAASLVAVSPIVVSYSWGTHLVLLLLPMFVLLIWAVERRDWGVIGLVGLSWVLIGPVHKLLQTLLVAGYSNLIVLRVLAEFGTVAVLALWIACLVAVRRSREEEVTVVQQATVNRVSWGAEKL